MHILWTILIGFVAGVIAKLLHPGPNEPSGFILTTILGIVGAFVGLAAMGGLMLNLAFLLAGTTSTNPVLAVLGVLLLLAWKNAGYIGLDYFLLPMLGTPWKQRTLGPGAQPVPISAPLPIHPTPKDKAAAS